MREHEIGEDEDENGPDSKPCNCQYQGLRHGRCNACNIGSTFIEIFQLTTGINIKPGGNPSLQVGNPCLHTVAKLRKIFAKLSHLSAQKEEYAADKDYKQQ